MPSADTYAAVLGLILKNKPKAVIQASGKGYFEVVNYLLDQKVDTSIDDYEAVRFASAAGHDEIVQLLLKRGPRYAAQANQSAALLYAASNGHTESVRILLDSGADISVSSYDVLRLAAGNGHVETTKLLLQRGAQVTLQAVAAAARRGQSETLRLLVKSETDPLVKDHALREAAVNGHPKIVALLLDLGTDPNSELNGQTPLLMAVTGGDLDIVKLLLDRGAKFGRFKAQALQLAQLNGYRDVQRFLQQL
jgi:ankyrin repeat protein